MHVWLFVVVFQGMKGDPGVAGMDGQKGDKGDSVCNTSYWKPHHKHSQQIFVSLFTSWYIRLF